MIESKYEKYAARTPLYEATPEAKGRQTPTMTFMSKKQTGAPYYIEYGWIYEMPNPNPHTHEHTHNYDEIVFHIGGDYTRPQVLGGEIEFFIGKQPITFNTTTVIYIPAGVPHGPLTWNKFEFPHIEGAMILGTGDRAEVWGESSIHIASSGKPVKSDQFDYEQYAVRSPMREAGDIFTKGRQSPTMTYMSKQQVNIANVYIEFGWIWDKVEPGIPRMVHENLDEIVLHIGGDPNDPEDLGADMEFGVGDDLLQFSKAYGMWIPKGLVHGPLNWHNVRKPHIEMAIMLGAGSMAEGWADSFFGEDGVRRIATPPGE